tara:strand:- start:881 stop:1513 length:633 start_codon:yes stop_codon:yes gene_type:complete
MINLILSDTRRSINYVEEIIKNKIEINKIFLYSKTNGHLYKFIKKNNLLSYLINFKTNNINSKIISNKLELYKCKTNIISTYPGEIVSNSSLLNKKLIHCHPGNLPQFKGSTTIYYSIIMNKKICVSIFVMNKKIDAGIILYKKYFSYPRNLIEIEKNFDSKIRALTLVEYLKNKRKKKYKFIKSNENYLPYYIAHPIVRKIVLNKSHLK